MDNLSDEVLKQGEDGWRFVARGMTMRQWYKSIALLGLVSRYGEGQDKNQLMKNVNLLADLMVADDNK